MRFSEDAVTSLTCSDGVARPLHLWQPAEASAVILAIHGGMAHAGDYVTTAQFFKAHGLATASLDMHGHDGKQRVDIPNFEVFLEDNARVLAWVKANFTGFPVFLMGHSMGALIATHLELGRFNADDTIRGVILSSPYYVNAIKVPAVMLALSRLLARWFPTARVPMAPLTDQLTHDAVITARHHADEKDHIRATEASFRFARALLDAQAALRGGLGRWRHPVFAVLAGDDKLADAQASQKLLATIPPALLELHVHPRNFHENFNELNRGEIFGSVLAWMRRIAPELALA